jgi:probable F420-dependent oxidoreductase
METHRQSGLDNVASPEWKPQEEAAMDFGALMFFTDYAIPAVELATALEERGFESVWAPEHSHIPTSRRPPVPGGGELPKRYYDAMDPFVSLTAAAVATTRLKVGTGVCLVQQRDPIQTAKLVASIDQISNGRFVFGVGGGWNTDEMENHGTDPKTRFKLMRERIEAMKEIWAKPKAEYHGDMVNFDEMMAWPKPVQKPYPPILVGGAFPQAARRAIRYGDGWCPIASGPGSTPLATLDHFRNMARDAGRDPRTLPVTLFNPDEDADQLARYRDLGVARVVVMLLSEPSAKIIPTLDRWATLIHRTA